jgi:hypothetical protein
MYVFLYALCYYVGWGPHVCDWPVLLLASVGPCSRPYITTVINRYEKFHLAQLRELRAAFQRLTRVPFFTAHFSFELLSTRNTSRNAARSCFALLCMVC